MHPTNILSLLTLSFLSLTSPVTATPIVNIADGTHGWATFYDDNACTVNPGVAVSMDNPGCVSNEFGRNSIYVQPGVYGTASLVFSPGNECDCQNECSGIPDSSQNYCLDLNGNVFATSFRFIQDCGANNC